VLGASSIFSKESNQNTWKVYFSYQESEWLKQTLKEPKKTTNPKSPKLLPGNKRLTYLMYFGPDSAIILGTELSGFQGKFSLTDTKNYISSSQILMLR